MSVLTRIRPSPRHVAWLVLAPSALAGAGYGLGRLFGVAIAGWQLWLLGFAVVASFQVMFALSAVPAGLPSRLRVAAPPSPDTQPFAQAVRWEDRLAWSETDGDRFAITVRDRLVPIVADRLWLSHRVDWHTEPERARALLPQELHRLLTEPDPTPPNLSEMDDIVRQIEEI